MATVNRGSFSVLFDGKILRANDLKEDRELLAGAIDDNQYQLYKMMFGTQTPYIFSNKAALDAFGTLPLEYYALVLADETRNGDPALYQNDDGTIVYATSEFSLLDLLVKEITLTPPPSLTPPHTGKWWFKPIKTVDIE